MATFRKPPPSPHSRHSAICACSQSLKIYVQIAQKSFNHYRTSILYIRVYPIFTFTHKRYSTSTYRKHYILYAITPAPPATLFYPQSQPSHTLPLSLPVFWRLFSAAPPSLLEDLSHTPRFRHTSFLSRCRCRMSYP